MRLHYTIILFAFEDALPSTTDKLFRIYGNLVNSVFEYNFRNDARINKGEYSVDKSSGDIEYDCDCN